MRSGACARRWRWVPGAVVLVAARVTGPVLAATPRWLALALAGTVLLVLGADWERRVQAAAAGRRRVRARLAALR